MSILDDKEPVSLAQQLAANKDVDGLVKLIEGMATKAMSLIERCDKAEEDSRVKEIYIKTLRRLLFGRRSEKLTNEELQQLSLAFDVDTASIDKDPVLPIPDEPSSSNQDQPHPTDQGKPKPKFKRPNHKGRSKLSEELERIVNEVLVPQSERQCQCCGTAMESIGFVDHETVQHIPEKFVVNVERREKVACKACRKDIATAPRESAPPDVRADASVLATLLDGKGEDALPIYRQADRFARLGWKVPYQTLLGYWAYAADLLLAIADATMSKVLDDCVVAFDDTPLDTLGEGKTSGKKKGHLWCATNTGPLTAFRFTQTWSHNEIAPWIDAATGFIQVDDYKGYSAIYTFADGRTGPLVERHRRLGCMMHVRRKFYEAFELKDKRASEPIMLIKRIYEIEAKAKELKLNADQRLLLRQSESLSALKRFYEILDGHKHEIGKTSKFARAVNYALAQKEFIERCFTDGRFEIDNGKTEREIRRPAIGRKNYLFAGSTAGGHRLAAVYTLILSCRNLGIDTREYLIDVIRKRQAGWPVSRLSELIPDNWAMARNGPTLKET